MGEDGEVVVLGGAEAMDEDDGLALVWGAVGVGVGVVEVVVVYGEGGHGCFWIELDCV